MAAGLRVIESSRSSLVAKALCSFDLNHDTILNRQANLSKLKPIQRLANLGIRPAGSGVFLEMTILHSFPGLLGKH